MRIYPRLLLLFLLLSVVPVAAVGVLGYLNTRETLEKMRIASIESVADLLAEKLVTYFEERKVDIENLRAAEDIQKALKALSAHAEDLRHSAAVKATTDLDRRFAPLIATRGSYIELILLSPEGLILYHSPSFQTGRLAGKKLTGVPDSVLIEGREGPIVSDPFRNPRHGGRLGSLVAAPVRDATGKFLGTIAIEVDLLPLFSAFQKLSSLGETGEWLIGRSTGREVVFLNPLRHDPQAAMTRKVRIGDPTASPLQLAAEGQSGTGTLVDYRGVEVLAAWRYIPSLRWGLVAKIDKREAFGLIDTMTGNFVILVTCTLLLVLLGAKAAARSFTNPVTALHRGAEIIGAGDFTHRTALASRDELGDLSRAIDAMTMSLNTVTASRDDLDREVAERKAAQERVNVLNRELERRNLELTEANRELEAFNYSISHDLKSPLQVIHGYCRILLEEYSDRLGGDCTQHLQAIQRNVEKMSRLIRDLFELSRAGRVALNTTKVDMGALARAVYAELPSNMRGSDPPPPLEVIPMPEGFGDMGLLRQVLINLLGNAVKFAKGREQARIETGGRRAGAENVYYVKDNGPGFAMQYSQKIFNVFERLHGEKEFEGSGVGLAIVKRIVERHGGRVWAEGEVDKGATFYFTLPAADT